MAEAFDPYRKWLGIPVQDQPPNHYRLLGIELFEADPDVISNAADEIAVPNDGEESIETKARCCAVEVIRLSKL